MAKAKRTIKQSEAAQAKRFAAWARLKLRNDPKAIGIIADVVEYLAKNPRPTRILG